MSLGRAIEDALRDRDEAGTVEATSSDGCSAEVEVRELDRIGMRVRRVRVRRTEDPDIAEEAACLPDRLRALPERVEPVEVAPGLGGAVFRTAPDEVQDGEFFELEVRGRDLDLQRQRAVPGADRQPVDWTMTREQLRRLLDQLE